MSRNILVVAVAAKYTNIHPNEHLLHPNTLVYSALNRLKYFKVYFVAVFVVRK